jgi:hypothetical protein
VQLLDRRNAHPDDAEQALAYLKAGGRGVDAVVRILARTSFREEQRDTYEEILACLGDRHEDQTIALLKHLEEQPLPDSLSLGRYRTLRWLQVHSAHCQTHRGELLQRVVEMAARHPVQIPVLLALSGIRPLRPEDRQDGLPIEEASPAVRQAAREALQTIYDRAEKELQERDLSPPVKAGFSRMIARAREGKSSAMFIGSTAHSPHLGYPIRDTSGALCAEMQVSVLSPWITDAVFFDPIRANHHHAGNVCRFAQEHPEGAALVLRCGGREGPRGEFLIRECSLEFPGDPPIFAGAELSPSLRFRPFLFTNVWFEHYLDLRYLPEGRAPPLSDPVRLLPEVRAYNRAIWAALRHAAPARR